MVQRKGWLGGTSPHFCSSVCEAGRVLIIDGTLRSLLISLRADLGLPELLTLDKEDPFKKALCNAFCLVILGGFSFLSIQQRACT